MTENIREFLIQIAPYMLQIGIPSMLLIKTLLHWKRYAWRANNVVFAQLVRSHFHGRIFLDLFGQNITRILGQIVGNTFQNMNRIAQALTFTAKQLVIHLAGDKISLLRPLFGRYPMHQIGILAAEELARRRNNQYNVAVLQ